MTNLRSRFGVLLGQLGRVIASLGQRLELGARFKPYREWVRARGDITRRLQYPLGSRDVVWDIGGYEGQWASDIFGRFCCEVHIFEPIADLAELLRIRFRHNVRIKIHHYALGASSSLEAITDAANGSSILKARKSSLSTRTVAVRDVVEVMHELQVDEVALVKINIEGSEYELLDRLIASGQISRFKAVQIQFHDFVPNANELRRRISENLGRTHTQDWCYDFVWESWSRKIGRSA